MSFNFNPNAGLGSQQVGYQPNMMPQAYLPFAVQFLQSPNYAPTSGYATVDASTYAMMFAPPGGYTGQPHGAYTGQPYVVPNYGNYAHQPVTSIPQQNQQNLQAQNQQPSNLQATTNPPQFAHGQNSQNLVHLGNAVVSGGNSISIIPNNPSGITYSGHFYANQPIFLTPNNLGTMSPLHMPSISQSQLTEDYIKVIQFMAVNGDRQVVNLIFQSTPPAKFLVELGQELRSKADLSGIGNFINQTAKKFGATVTIQKDTYTIDFGSPFPKLEIKLDSSQTGPLQHQWRVEIESAVDKWLREVETSPNVVPYLLDPKTIENALKDPVIGNQLSGYVNLSLQLLSGGSFQGHGPMGSGFRLPMGAYGYPNQMVLQHHLRNDLNWNRTLQNLYAQEARHANNLERLAWNQDFRWNMDWANFEQQLWARQQQFEHRALMDDRNHDQWLERHLTQWATSSSARIGRQYGQTMARVNNITGDIYRKNTQPTSEFRVFSVERNGRTFQTVRRVPRRPSLEEYGKALVGAGMFNLAMGWFAERQAETQIKIEAEAARRFLETVKEYA
ncbi:MAG: hypothetical protein NZO16_07260 [Deltaproteobacteria bacterium]|nr:hypothetical protein [Deltaproteobacteria bacterium]